MLEDWEAVPAAAPVSDWAARWKRAAKVGRKTTTMQTIWGEDWMTAYHQSQAERDAALARASAAEAALRFYSDIANYVETPFRDTTLHYEPNVNRDNGATARAYFQARGE